MTYDIYCVCGDLNNLLLCDGLNVINGCWTIRKGSDGKLHAPITRFPVQFLMSYTLQPDETDNWDRDDVELIFRRARERFSLPLFDSLVPVGEFYCLNL